MKILVLGGTGAMGVHLVKLLADRGDQVSVTTRQPRQSIENVNYRQGNARDIDFLKELLQEQWDAIVDFMVYTTPEFTERVNLLLASTTQYVYLSSARVYANSETPITEESQRLLDVSKDNDYLATDEYALLKARQENILRDSGHTNWTIIRPYITYSENRLQLGVLEKEEWLYRALKGRTIVFSDDMTSKFTTLTYGFDVAKGILAIIGNAKAQGEAFHIAIEDSFQWKEIIEIYTAELEQHLGFKPKVVLQKLDDFLICKPSRFQVLYDRLFNRRFDSSKIAEYLEMENLTKTEHGLSSCLNKFLKDPQFNGINWRTEALKDKFTGEHASLTEIKGIKNKLRYLAYRYLNKK
ncbi:NAD-dependent epimerase/dehydratase family protein [Mangrovibacterium sp.]|uniref:NAD-dependent epimerase/dehydratase family protein n=1 Tax=Mangrovibacterium sp. TaxID=1961364 RepID=UPI0035698F4D